MGENYRFLIKKTFHILPRRKLIIQLTQILPLEIF